MEEENEVCKYCGSYMSEVYKIRWNRMCIDCYSVACDAMYDAAIDKQYEEAYNSAPEGDSNG